MIRSISSLMQRSAQSGRTGRGLGSRFFFANARELKSATLFGGASAPMSTCSTTGLRLKRRFDCAGGLYRRKPVAQRSVENDLAREALAYPAFFVKLPQAPRAPIGDGVALAIRRLRDNAHDALDGGDCLPRRRRITPWRRRRSAQEGVSHSGHAASGRSTTANPCAGHQIT